MLLLYVLYTTQKMPRKKKRDDISKKNCISAKPNNVSSHCVTKSFQASIFVLKDIFR